MSSSQSSSSSSPSSDTEICQRSAAGPTLCGHVHLLGSPGTGFRGVAGTEAKGLRIQGLGL